PRPARDALAVDEGAVLRGEVLDDEAARRPQEPAVVRRHHGVGDDEVAVLRAADEPAAFRGHGRPGRNARGRTWGTDARRSLVYQAGAPRSRETAGFAAGRRPARPRGEKLIEDSFSNHWQSAVASIEWQAPVGGAAPTPGSRRRSHDARGNGTSPRVSPGVLAAQRVPGGATGAGGPPAGDAGLPAHQHP